MCLVAPDVQRLQFSQHLGIGLLHLHHVTVLILGASNQGVVQLRIQERVAAQATMGFHGAQAVRLNSRYRWH